MPGTPGQTWVNVEEAASILGFSKGRVRQLIAPNRRGGARIPSRMFGHIRRMRRVDVENFRPLTGPRGGRPMGYKPPLPAGPSGPRKRVRTNSGRGSPMVPFVPPRPKPSRPQSRRREAPK